MATASRGGEAEAAYRVDYVGEGERRVVGRLAGGTYHHFTSLDPFVGPLRAAGRDGTLLLVEEATGRVVARRRVRPFGERSGCAPPRPAVLHPPAAAAGAPTRCPFCGGAVAASGNFCLACGRSIPPHRPGGGGPPG